MCSYIVTCYCGTSIVKSFKLLALPHPFFLIILINIIVSTSIDWLTTILAYLNRYPW